jgi:hypothetical protein
VRRKGVSEAAGLSIACAALSVQFNVVAGIQRGDWLSVEARLWMPALALGVWYWLLHGRHRRWTREAASADVGGGREVEQRRPPSTFIDERVIDLVRTNPRATWRTVMARTGLSDANSKRALTTARRKLRAEASATTRGRSVTSQSWAEELLVVIASATGQARASRWSVVSTRTPSRAASST